MGLLLSGQGPCFGMMIITSIQLYISSKNPVTSILNPSFVFVSDATGQSDARAEFCHAELFRNYR